MHFLTPLIAASLLSTSIHAKANTADFDAGLGILDKPLPSITTPLVLATPTPLVTIDDQAKLNEILQTELGREQSKLAQLSRDELLGRADQGERAAQVAIAEDYAKEADQLAFAPAAANDALSDALRWYALAAKRGFPGAPSLDRAGVQFYPIRVHRTN